MKKQILKAIGGVSVAILMLAVFAQVRVSAQDNDNELLQNGNVGNEQSLVGSWDVTISIVSCQNPAIVFFSFPATITYNQGGTMQESDLGGPGIVRLLGHGVWERQRGRRYSAAFRWLNFLPDRTPAGKNVVRETIRLGRGGDTYTSTATVVALDANGNVIPGAGGCGTETATRFE